MMKRILIVEDDPSILLGLETAFQEEGYDVVSATDGERGYHFAKTRNPDLIILDIMLPKKSGHEICRDLRNDKINTPILMLTSKKEEIDKILGFEFGADDYVTKPFSVRELMLRVKVLLKRSAGNEKTLEEFEFGNIIIDFKKLEAKKGNQLLNLSAKEFQILKYFTEREGQVISRDMLLDDVWGYENFPSTRTVDNYILSLRKAIEEDSSHPKHLLTIHTVGYKFIKGE
jgi:DNA-binding response OmpR family regulator